ncbi:hypothetical protein CBER1_04286 [Cercospora berteroae]|uniref:DUF7605 domain-containing protein n=1 Tax=Cercospora berteroae TaxID=357750 RepID=A0A2S6C6B7_9PEZI|nr:hypothetical protein CBER1_04286 [Cercospora berteroae]
MRRPRSAVDAFSTDPTIKRRKMLKNNAQVLASALAQGLAENRGVSKEFENADQVASEAAQDPDFAKPVIGLFGGTEQGKSELVNAVTGQSDASKSAGSGNALTSVAMLFVSPFHDQRKKHCAIIHIKKQNRLRATVTQWVRDYAQFHFDANAELPAEGLAKREKLAELAQNKFRTLFNNKAGFRTEADISNFFENRSDDNVAIVEQLLAWCDELLVEFDLADGHRVRRFENDESSTLNDALEQYIYNQDGFATPLLWPLVDLVEKVCPDSPHLRYFHLLDLPGISETDESRGSIAHDHFLRCQALWVVGNISRASADKKLDDILATYGQRFGQNVVMVLTFSDASADANTAKELEKQSVGMGDYWRETERVRDIIDDMAKAKAQHALASSPGHRGRLAEIMVELRDGTLPQSETAQLDAFVEARKHHIAAKLRASKQHHLPSTVQLKVFCVSSTHYNARIAGSDLGNTTMSLEVTNIPSLQLHALSLAGDAKFSGCYSRVNSTIGLFESLALWTAASPKRPRDFKNVLNAPANHLEALSTRFQRDMPDMLNESLLHPVAEGRKLFCDQALKALREIWIQYRPTSFQAFIFRNGEHSTALQEREVWNEKFAEAQNMLICKHFPLLLQRPKTLFQEYIDEILECLQTMFEKLTENADVKLVTMLKGLMNSYLNRIRNSHAQLITGNDGVDNLLEIIKEKATKNVTTGYFRLALDQTYNTCKEERGPGCTRRMTQRLSNALDGLHADEGFPCPFEAVSAGLNEDLTTALNKLGKQFHDNLKDNLLQLKEDLQRAYQDTTTARSDEEIRAHEQLKSLLNDKQHELDSLKSDLSALKQKYNMPLDELQQGAPKSILQRIMGYWG